MHARLTFGVRAQKLYHIYISVGDRVRPPSKGCYAPAALGEQRVRVIDCGPSPGGCVIPGAMYQVPSTVYFSPAASVQQVQWLSSHHSH